MRSTIGANPGASERPGPGQRLSLGGLSALHREEGRQRRVHLEGHRCRQARRPFDGGLYDRRHRSRLSRACLRYREGDGCRRHRVEHSERLSRRLSAEPRVRIQVSRRLLVSRRQHRDRRVRPWLRDDISSPDRMSDDTVWAWFDQNSKNYGLRRPLPATDPVHIQPLLGPAWHEKAAARGARVSRDPATPINDVGTRRARWRPASPWSNGDASARRARKPPIRRRRVIATRGSPRTRQDLATAIRRRRRRLISRRASGTPRSSSPSASRRQAHAAAR